MEPTASDILRRAHALTKHDVHAYAPGPGRLDWATQPDPYRRYEGARRIPLAFRSSAPACTWDAVVAGSVEPQPVDATTVGDFLRHAMALSAEKSAGGSRWSLRVNPSSGNLHPIECWLATGPIEGLTDVPALFHHAPDTHELERRAVMAPEAWSAIARGLPHGAFLVALSSIAWREAWKYGVRAFRYCRHDAGHAIASLSVAASVHGWRLDVVRAWGTCDVAALLGLDRDDGQVEGEHEEAEALCVVRPRDLATGAQHDEPAASDALVELLRASAWSGRANRLSPAHVDWPLIPEAERASRATRSPPRPLGRTVPAVLAPPRDVDALAPPREVDARALVLQRRSAVDFDGHTGLSRDAFLRMLRATLPSSTPCTRALAAPPRVHLVLFVHRVDGVQPGIHVLARTTSGEALLREAMSGDLAWTRWDAPDLMLHALVEGDARSLARTSSCHQDIAADGAFSLGMLAEMGAALEHDGGAAMRELYWECGAIGQALYLEAEAAGVRATGIGCYFDDAVHRTLGLRSDAIQDLYHLAVGAPVDDPRIVTSRPYVKERTAGG